MKKTLLISAAVVASLLFFVGCDDDGTGSDDSTPQLEGMWTYQTQMAFPTQPEDTLFATQVLNLMDENDSVDMYTRYDSLVQKDGFVSKGPNFDENLQTIGISNPSFMTRGTWDDEGDTLSLTHTSADVQGSSVSGIYTLSATTLVIIPMGSTDTMTYTR